MNAMNAMNAIGNFVHEEEGVTAIEYGLIAALVAVAIIVGATSLGTNLNGLFQRIADCIAAPTGGACAAVA
jgi:pilus assembly protein Flp/PilA